jgi:exopolysaccharide biosynthesis polyprenyl glycosylphosphotransferase
MPSSAFFHPFSVFRRAFPDLLIFVGGYLAANYLRFSAFWRLGDYVIPMVGGGAAFISVVYVLGLYSPESQRRSSFLQHVIVLSFGFLIALVIITLLGYVHYDHRIGRGFMALGSVLSYPFIAFYHWLLYNKHELAPERIAFVSDHENGRAEWELLRNAGLRGLVIVGRIGVSRDGSEAEDCLGNFWDARKIISAHRIDRIVFSEQIMEHKLARTELRRLHYLGFPCSSICSICEKHLNYVPLHLVSMNWLLLSESAASRDLYFGKLKRFFDVTISLVLLVLLVPFLALGMLIVRFFSPEGPVFYRQERVGRFGKRFHILKLRSMKLDAENLGPVWASASKDDRVFPGGGFLRRYRIDEIPQLINILRGEMSFVGPRPERPEFVAQLVEKLPYYEERHLVNPGLTGWAQVCFPYGSSFEDARSKLEYDLYYLKHAGIIFDFLILLDTVRVVLAAGQRRPQTARYAADLPSYTKAENVADRVA